MATLRLFSDSLDPADVSHILSIKPDISARKGAPLFNKKGGKPVPARTGTWFVTTQHRHFGNPADHLKFLANLAISHLGQLRDTIPDLKIDFSLLVHDADFDARSIPTDLLKQVTSLGDLEIEVPVMNTDFVITSANIDAFLAK